MALGKNLTKQKLISNKKEEGKKKRNGTLKKKPVVEKPQPQQPTGTPQPIDARQFLDNFITESQKNRRDQLRESYKKEIKALKNKHVQLIVFNVGEERYCVEIDKVKEVVPTPNLLAEAPHTPEHVKGIATIRRNNYLAYDLQMKFLKTSQKNTSFAMVIGRTEQSNICFLLDSIPATLKISGEFISSDLTMLDNATRSSAFIKGIVHHDEGIIFYLDINELIESDKAVIIPDEMTN